MTARKATPARNGATKAPVRMAPPRTTRETPIGEDRPEKPFLSEKARAFIRSRLLELGGFCLGLSALILFVILATYDQADPSLNTATPDAAKIHNWLGGPGAVIADLTHQSLGTAAYLITLVMMGWAWRLGAGRPLRRPIARTLIAALGVLAAAIALAATGGVDADPLRPPAGGSLGLLLLDHLTLAVAGYSSHGVPLTAIATAAAVVAGALLFIAMGAPMDEWMAGVRRFGSGIVAIADGIGACRRAVGAWFGALGNLVPRPSPRTVPVDGGDDGYGADGDGRRAPRFDGGIDSAHQAAPRAADFQPSGERTSTVEIIMPPAGKSEPPAGHRKGPDPRQTSLHFEDEEVDTYELPPIDLLTEPDPKSRRHTLDGESLKVSAKVLEGVLGDFGVRGTIDKVHPGPVVTLYELEPAPGTKSARVVSLADDIARQMSAVSVRVAVVPGRNVIGIELPNQTRETVYLRELMASEAFVRASGKLMLALGKDIGGQPVIADLARFPHLLVAGTTGSGKSVAINTMILSLLYRMPPDRCRFIMIDPKMLELSVYEGIPHLLTPVVTDPKKAVVALRWTVREMEERYRNMSRLGVRNVEGYNARLRQARDDGESLTRKVQTGFDPDTGKPLFEEQPIDLHELPYIVVIVDEMADLMLVAGKDIEGAIQRLAQMARAAGIHIIMATQRPSVDVITGTIKANFPTRISFQVTSKIDSRTILGEQGAEQLLGQGDMLYMAGGGRITRVHGPFVSDDEVEHVVRFLKTQGEPAYVDAILEDEDEDGAGGGDWDGGGASRGGGSGSGGNGNADDELYDKAVAIVCRERKPSISFVQRQLRVGYNSAARLIERMESEGVISKPNHSGRREVLAPATREE